ncbi:MAG: hypothetical protein HUU60_08380 [Armatimonadetes bacterium]|nr:hypothetical protein [Armatimonadota bacterium]
MLSTLALIFAFAAQPPSALALMVQDAGLRSDREQGRFLRSDLNKDGLVDPLDMEILLRSMGRRGD